MTSDPYRDLAEPFVGHYDTLRGTVRHSLVSRQLREHLASPPGAVLDVGGGTAHQSLPLARSGYAVTILDPSQETLGRAARQLQQESPEVRERVDLVEARGEDAPEVLAGRSFQTVLCHGVVMYLENPDALLRSLAALLATDGVVSVLAKNASALALRPALQGRWRDALEVFDTDRDVGNLGVVTRGDEPQRVADVFARAGVEEAAWYGVRVLTDYPTRERPGSDLDDVLEAEWEAGRRDPYRRVARLFHWVGVKVRCR